MLRLVALTSVLLSCSVVHAQTTQDQTPTPESDHTPAVHRSPFGVENIVTLHIRLLNGKTGQPIPDKEVFLERSAMHLMSHAEDKDAKTDASGVAEVNVAKSGAILNPVVIDYKSCTPRTRHDGDKDKSVRFPVAQILSSGVVAQNTCGKSSQSPTPGELILYFRPMNVFEKITD